MHFPERIGNYEVAILAPGDYELPITITHRITPGSRKFSWFKLADDYLRAPEAGPGVIFDFSKRIQVKKPGPVFFEQNRTRKVTLRVVPPKEAVPVRPVSNPALDRRMGSAIWTRPMVGGYLYSKRTRRMEGGLNIFYRRLPENMAIKAVFVDDKGNRTPITYAKDIGLLYRGRSGFILWVEADVNQFVEPGTYRGKLELKPDRELANRDAEMKTIWGGTLEFPVSFTVRPAAK